MKHNFTTKAESPGRVFGSAPAFAGTEGGKSINPILEAITHGLQFKFKFLKYESQANRPASWQIKVPDSRSLTYGRLALLTRTGTHRHNRS
jgi:hypothetical protein